MINVHVEDGYGRGNKLKVNGEGELSVVVHPHPPKDENVTATPFRSYFLNAGSNDMRVDGSTTPVKFSVTADALKDTYVKSVFVSIVDAGATLAEFGNLSALTNGLDFTWESADLGTVTIADQIKTNYDFTRLSIVPAANAIASNVVGTAEGVAIVIDLEIFFGMQYGFRLRAGTTDKISFTVNDDLSTGITEFNILGYGFKF